jgi:MFS transporter, DHA1 family, tetracycline resistance protein
VQRYGEKRVLATGLVLAAIGLGSAAVVHTVPVFIVTLIPAAVGAALSSPTLTALLSQTTLPSEQGRVQGVSGALESLGRAVGPLWGNGVLQAFGEGTAYASAAAMLLLIGLATAWVPLKAAPQPGADGQPPSLALKPDPDAPLQPGTD